MAVGNGSIRSWAYQKRRPGGAPLSVSKYYGHREPARRLVHPRVVSLALRAIHLLAIPHILGKTMFSESKMLRLSGESPKPLRPQACA